MKKISILGSTGSIGTQALDVIRNNSNDFTIVGLSTYSNIELLYKQIQEFHPSWVTVVNKEAALALKEKLNGSGVYVFSGTEGLSRIAALEEADMVLNSVVGMVGLIPTIEAIKCGKSVALANKETLVAGGVVVKDALKDSSSKIVPVDSEHCAVFQCLQCSQDQSEIRRLILTASGGPFRGRTRKELEGVTQGDALKHPNWSMGRKITIDSATLMNKGLEVIEAHWLFNTDYHNIDVIVHPQSVIHSMVEMKDGAVIAQMGVPDMRNPILYALGYPKRMEAITKRLSFSLCSSLTFEEPDMETFRCLKLAYLSGKEGGTMPAVLNASNEVAVDLFLKGRIAFLDIPDIVEECLTKHRNKTSPCLEDILEADRLTRAMIYNNLKVV